MSKPATINKYINKKNKLAINILFYFFVCLNIFPILKSSLNLTDIFINTASLLCLLALFFISSFISYKEKIFSRNGVILFISSCVLMLILATYAATNIATVEFSFVNYVTAPIILIIFFVFLGNTKMDKGDLYSFNNKVIAFTFVACLYNIIINYKNILLVQSIANSYEYSFSSFYSNRNYFGLLIAIGMALIMYNWVLTKSKNKKTVYIILGMIFIFSIFLTQSRGAILLLLVFSFTYLVLRSGLAGFVKLSIFLFSLFILASAVLGGSYISDNFIRENSGDSGRSTLRAYGLESYKSSNILFGAGYGKPTQKLNEKYQLSSFHSNYVTILVTGGIVQGVFYLCLLIFSFRNIMALKAYDKNSYAFFSAFITGYLIYGALETILPFQLFSNNFIVSVFIIYMPFYLLNSYKFKKSSNYMVVKNNE